MTGPDRAGRRADGSPAPGPRRDADPARAAGQAGERPVPGPRIEAGPSRAGDRFPSHVLMPAAGSSRRLGRRTEAIPKSLLRVGPRAIIEHSLEALAARGVERLTLVAGYRKEALVDRLGARYGPIGIDYVNSPDYARTEHGWSLYLTRAAWEARGGPVLFMDADNLYDPAILDVVAAHGAPDVIAVDSAFDGGAREEEIVTGRGGRVSRLLRGRTDAHPDRAGGFVGGFVGVNRLSGGFMRALYEYMEGFFAAHGRSHKYERVIDRFLRDTGTVLRYVDCAPREWVNVNQESDLPKARRVARLMTGSPPATAP